MKTVVSLRRRHYLARASIFLATLALIIGMVGCGGDGTPTVEIRDWYDLDAISDNLGGSYILMNDLDSTTATAGYEELASPTANGGKGWQPIGIGAKPFKGTFDGGGNTISDLFIYRPDEDEVGLFGRVQEGLVKHVGLVSVNVTGKKSVGALVGYNWKGKLDSDTRPPYSKTYSHGSVTGQEDVGGLVGNNYDGTVNQCESSAEVFQVSSAPDEERWRAGGLVGLNGGTVSNCDYNGAVNGDRQVGGLVGHNALVPEGRVEDCGGAYSVHGNLEVGGVAGRNLGALRRNSYTGKVNGILTVIGDGLTALNEGATGNADSSDTALPGEYIGGVVGWNGPDGTVDDCSAEATVVGYRYVGGAAGKNDGIMTGCNSSGYVTGNLDVGRFVGYNTGTLSNPRSTSCVTDTPDCGDLVGRNEGFIIGMEATGAFLDEVLITEEPNFRAAVTRLQTDDLDLFACGLADAALYQTVLSDPNLTHTTSLGSYNEFTFNPVGPVFNGTGKLNPFAVPKFREAMNRLVDRDYICNEIMGGLAVPRVCAVSTAGVDGTVRFAAEVAALETEYAFNKAKAEAAIKLAMEGLGATKEGGKWMYKGEQVVIIGAIRTEDERKLMGDYFGNLLQDQGFAVTRTYGTSGVLSPIWRTGDPNRGVFHFYTGGWVTTAIPLDEGDNFGSFYTNLWSAMGPLWQAYVNDPAFYAAAEKLWNYDYASMSERGGYLKTCLDKSLEESQRIWLCDRASYTPMRADVRVAADAYGGVYGSWMWALTAHFVDEDEEPIVGGTMRIGTCGILTEPWNPVAGTNWVYDMFPMRATGDMDTQPDTRTGLRWAGRLEKAEVIVKQGQPVEVTNTDWCKLTFIPEIQVPLDAWADWDAVTQKFLTVRDRFGPTGTTAIRETKAYFPKDIFETPLHDGSTLSVGDFLMSAILTFDRAKPESALYDEGYVAEFDAFMSMFKGVKFTTDDPDYGLIVEFYSDLCGLNAELMVRYTSTFFPTYSQGPGMWHTIALAIMAEEHGELAFGREKADELEIEWTSFIAGPSIPILKSNLDSAKASNYIPFEPTMGDYITEAEATERWTSLSTWYEAYKHFWVASGPFYLFKAFTTEKVIQLKRFEDYPDPMDRWLFLLDPLP